MKEATLIIFNWYSKCSACNGGADPYEKTHTTQLGYFSTEVLDDPDHPLHKGCGAKFTGITAGMYGLGIENDTKRMRPDLPYINDKFFTT